MDLNKSNHQVHLYEVRTVAISQQSTKNVVNFVWNIKQFYNKSEKCAQQSARSHIHCGLPWLCSYQNQLCHSGYDEAPVAERKSGAINCFECSLLVLNSSKILQFEEKLPPLVAELLKHSPVQSSVLLSLYLSDINTKSRQTRHATLFNREISSNYFANPTYISHFPNNSSNIDKYLICLSRFHKSFHIPWNCCLSSCLMRSNNLRAIESCLEQNFDSCAFLMRNIYSILIQNKIRAI